MTSKRVVFTGADGVLSVLIPAPGVVAAMMGAGGLVAADRVEAEIAGLVAAGVSAAAARNYVEGIATGGLTERQAVARIQAKDVPAGVTDAEVIEAAALPYRGGLRAAWRKPAPGVVDVDLDVARALVLGRLRAMRDRRLAAEDTAQLRAIETRDTAAQAKVAARKQALRDAPATALPALAALADPAALDAWRPNWPE